MKLETYFNQCESTTRSVLMLLSNSFDPDPRVYREALSLIQYGYDVTILCWDRDYKASSSEIIDGIKIERIHLHSTHGRGSTQLFFLCLFWLKAYLKSFYKNFDIVHCHDFDTLPLGFLLRIQKKAKIIYDSHESYVDMLINIPSWLKKMILTFENFFLKRVNLLITVGEILRYALEKRGAPKTCVVGNWKNPDEFIFSHSRLEDEKKKLGISTNQLIISFIANLTEERQLPQLLEAVKESSNVFLIIGGAGSCVGAVKDAAHIYSNIHYLGFVRPVNVPFYTAMSDAIFYGFDPENRNARFSAPNKLFEALAAGKSVLTGDFGEIAKIVREYNCGIILDSYSKSEIARKLNLLTPSTLSIHGENALKAAKEKFNWEYAERVLLSNYHKV